MAETQTTGTEPQAQTTAQQSPAGASGQGAAASPAAAFDYEKLANIIQGKQSVAEDTVLKNYFKQQGLSTEEATQAIAAFKQQKAAQQPDVATMQTQLTQAQTAAQQAQAAVLQAQLQNAATMSAVGLGIDAKTIPYVLKLADLSGAVGQDGKINEEAVKTALNKVLEDLPTLKPAQTSGTTGFVQVGSAGSPAQQPQTTSAQPTVAKKSWNRFNY